MSLRSESIRFLARITRPGSVAVRLAFLFRWILRIFPVRRKIASRNIEIALPDKTHEERRKILLGTYDHLVWVGIEFTALQRDPKQVLDWMEVENPEALDRGGGILFTCHVGNWELAAAWIAQSGHKITAIVREAADEGERGVIAEMRANAGVSCLPKTASMTRAIAILRRNEFLAIMPDQHGGTSGLRVPRFVLETSTFQGASVFAYLTKKPLIPVFTRRVAPFRHRMRFGEPLRWKEEENRERTIYGITRVINESVARIIREAPDQWLAQHKRFKEYY